MKSLTFPLFKIYFLRETNRYCSKGSHSNKPYPKNQNYFQTLFYQSWRSRGHTHSEKIVFKSYLTTNCLQRRTKMRKTGV